MPPRTAFPEPPYSPFVQAELDRLTPPGVPPLGLFRVLAGDERLFRRFVSGGLLDRGHLSLRQREIIIDRVTARCGSEYEWGAHITLFGPRAGLTPAQVQSLFDGAPSDTCWATEDERVLIRVCDHVQEHCDLSDELWLAARQQFSEPAMIEVLMLNGFYRMVAYLTNALRIPLEPWAHRFPAPVPR